MQSKFSLDRHSLAKSLTGRPACCVSRSPSPIQRWQSERCAEDLASAGFIARSLVIEGSRSAALAPECRLITNSQALPSRRVGAAHREALPTMDLLRGPLPTPSHMKRLQRSTPTALGPAFPVLSCHPTEKPKAPVFGDRREAQPADSFAAARLAMSLGATSYGNGRVPIRQGTYEGSAARSQPQGRAGARCRPGCGGSWADLLCGQACHVPRLLADHRIGRRCQ